MCSIHKKDVFAVFYLFQRLDAPLQIFPQVCAQCICRDSCYAAYLVMAQSQALQPKGFHFTLNSGMGMMISLLIQCLHLFFREFYPDHRYHLVDFIAQTKRCQTIYKCTMSLPLKSVIFDGVEYILLHHFPVMSNRAIFSVNAFSKRV
jgi:hypothetical protein